MLDDETPDAQAMLGDAQVIEGGGTDASSTTVEDNHVEVSVVIPPAPEPEPEPDAGESAVEQIQEGAAVAELRGRVDALDDRLAAVETAQAALLAAPPDEEPEPEAAPAPAPAEEDRPPKRTMWLHKKPFSRKDDE